MGQDSKIEWTHHTFNPWIGCTKVSSACAHCYAERDFDLRYKKATWGPSGTRVLTSDANWRKPLQWNRTAESLGVRYRVFCASLSDVFEDWDGPIMSPGSAPVILGKDWRASDGQYRLTMQDVRSQVFDLIDQTTNLDWLLLTKRPENIWRMTPDKSRRVRPCLSRRDNLWLGVSVENQACANSRIPELLQCADLAAMLFLSCEPVVGPIDLTFVESSRFEWRDCLKGMHVGSSFQRPCPKIDWVITGGESGPDARPSSPEWFRSLRSQCEASRTAFHFKQWGEFDAEGNRVGKRNAGRLLDGVEHNGLPSEKESP